MMIRYLAATMGTFAFMVALTVAQDQPAPKKKDDVKDEDAKAAQDDPKKLIERIHENLEQARSKLEKKDPSEGTRKTQQQVIDDLKKLLDQKNKSDSNSPQGGGGEGDPMGGDPMGQGGGDPQGGNNQPKGSNNSQGGADPKGGNPQGNGQKKDDTKDKPPMKLNDPEKKNGGGKKNEDQKGGGKDDPEKKKEPEQKEEGLKSKNNAEKQEPKQKDDKEEGLKKKKDKDDPDKKDGKGNPKDNKDKKGGDGSGGGNKDEKNTLANQMKGNGEWGKLPEKRRQEMDTFLRERYPERYSELLRVYYQNFLDNELRKKKE